MAIPTKKQPVKNTAPTPTAAAKHKGADSDSHILIKETPDQFPLARRNFILMIVAGLLIIIGFILMLGGGSTPEKFNPDIFSTRRIVIGPTLAFLGFVFMGIAIIIRPSRKKSE